LTTTITATGCSAQDTVVVTVDESAPTANAGNDFTKTCVENTSGKEIGAIPVSGMTYSWLPTTGLDDATKANPIANPTVTTTYTLTTTITATGCSAQDTVTVTVLNTQKPLALGVTIENNCPVETVDLTTIQPTPVSGIIYEWWTGTASTRLTQINNTSSYETSGKVYLWGKSSTGGCYGLQGSEVEVIITPCCAASVGTLRDISPFSDYYEPADLTKLSHTNYTNAAIVRYVLVNDADGKIKHINNTEPKFFGASAGNYTAHAIVFGPTANPVGIEIGKKLSQIQPFCGSSASTRMIVRQNNCSSAETFNTTITNAKAYAFLNLNTNTFDQVNTTGIFINRKDGFHYQIVGFDFTGTATGIQVGGTMTGVSANNLDIILGNVVRGCAPVTTQIDGLLYNDKDKTCKEGNNKQLGLPNTTLYVKLINSKNEVIAVSQVKPSSYLFSFSSDLFDGKYTVIVDDNNDFSDITPTYPANWKGNSQTFTIVSGQIVEFLSNTANFVPLCMQSTTVIATDDTASGIDGFSGVKNVLNVLTNDTVDLSTAKINNVNISVITPDTTAKLVLNPDGSVDVKAGTPAGTYTFVYEICTINTPKVCAQAKVTITVVAPTIIAVNDDYSTKPINASKGTVLDILANDKIGNVTINATQVSISIIDTNGIEGVTVDAQGRVVIPAGIPIGTYVLTYRICDVINPSNCATASIIIVVKDSCDFDDSPSSCDILVHNAFSPNNDGINEVFTIERIEKYPDNSVEIYNRWGVLVFEVSGYDNTSKVFVGLSEGRVTVNKTDTLPSGTYYYVIKYKKPISGIVNQKAGFLYISK
ncbi:gliding motility-associated C-terminal domain-containing protein, partial [Flavobacterium sp.]|uniref:gliding motility-associated C-terminal domain-containing protein n=1 Tax=Flavobacterium sp. TaxID=239 RepID=UPI00261FFA81